MDPCREITSQKKFTRKFCRKIAFLTQFLNFPSKTPEGISSHNVHRDPHAKFQPNRTARSEDRPNYRVVFLLGWKPKTSERARDPPQQRASSLTNRAPGTCQDTIKFGSNVNDSDKRHFYCLCYCRKHLIIFYSN